MSRDVSLDDQVDSLFPLDGPYSGDDTRAAARSIAVPVRYLCHATRYAEAVPEPSTVDSVIGSLSSATSGLDQLLGQLDDHMTRFSEHPHVYATGDRPVGEVCWLVGSHLRVAASDLRDAQSALAAAAEYSSRIGLNEPEDGS